MSGSKRKGKPMGIGMENGDSTKTESVAPPGETLASTLPSPSESAPVVQEPRATIVSAETEKQRRRKPKAVMDETVRRVNAGESVEALAKELDVEPKAIRKWVRSAGGSIPAPDAPVTDSGVLHKALGAAGITPDTVPPLEPAQTAVKVEATGVMPPPSPEQLMLIIEGIDRVTISAIVGLKGKGLSPRELEQACKLPKNDRDMMEALAPYAADYLPSAMAYAKPVMACLFVGVWGLSVVTRLKTVQVLAQEKAMERRHEREGS